jgi:predicted RNA binding protein YcfA (HicA-like mRNA interferase family)
MPKLKVLSGEDLVKFLEEQGFELSYGKGSHAKMTRISDGEYQALVIPLHKEIAKGTLKAIYNQVIRFVPKDKLHQFFYTL